MKNALIVFKKEFYRVISDRRLLFMSILFPGIMIFAMYSLMGNVMQGETEDIQEHTMIIYEENMPDSIRTSISGGDSPVEFHALSEMPQDDIEDAILAGTIDLLIVFPEDFEADLANYEADGYVIPTIDTYYNSGEKYSNNTYYTVQSYLGAYSNAVISSRFDEGIFAFHQNPTVIVNEERAQGQGFAMLLPMLIVMFLFSGAMNIGPDSIAGEKERGTIATLLVTPVKRFEIAIGKVLSLSIISLISATSSFIGIIFGLRNLTNGAGGSGELNAGIYGVSEYLMIVAVLFATVLVIVGIISVVSTYARTIKEAGMLILPFYFISIIIGVSSMFSGEAATDTILYLIPIYNSVNMLISILTFDVVPMQFMLTIISSVVYVTILIFVMNRLFQNEKVMFSK